MGFIKKFKDNHRGMFEYLKSDEIHLHDHLMDRIILRFIPKSVTPNEVTTVRVLMTPVVFWFILYGDYTVGVVLFLVVALTDAIDGSLARTRHKITLFGKLYDPLADKFLIGAMVLLLVFQHFNFWLGITVLVIEIVFILVAAVTEYKFKTIRGANIWGKIKMLLQVLAVFLTLLALLIESPVLLSIAAWVFGIAIGFALLSLFSHGV